MIHNEHHKLSTFIPPLALFLIKNSFSIPIPNPYQIIVHSFILKYVSFVKTPQTKFTSTVVK